MYEETNGLAMGSPLGPSVFNYMVHIKSKIAKKINNRCVKYLYGILFLEKNLDSIKETKARF